MADKTFDLDGIFSSARSVVSDTLLEIGRLCPDVVVMTADLARTNQLVAFQETFPERFLNVGIAEQNLFGMAAGLALEGKTPFVCTMATFASMRACEQLRTDICYQNLNVRIIANNAGLTSTGGATHNGQEDLAVLRSFPNLTIVTPGDPGMFREVLLATLHHKGPVYIRMGSGKKEGVVYEEGSVPYRLGKAIQVREGNDIALIACGVAVSEAVRAARMLAEEGVNARVLDLHTIKPLDTQAVLNAARETGRVLTVEDHCVIGGLGSAVAETLAESGVACRFKRLGIPQVYAGFGPAEDLYAKYGYDAKGIVRAARCLLC